MKIIFISESLLKELTSNIDTTKHNAFKYTFEDYFNLNNESGKVVQMNSLGCKPINDFEFDNRLDDQREYMWMVAEKLVAWHNAENGITYVDNNQKDTNIISKRRQHKLSDFLESSEYVDNVAEILKKYVKPSESSKPEGKLVGQKNIKGVLFKAYYDYKKYPYDGGEEWSIIIKSGNISAAQAIRFESGQVATRVFCNYTGYGLGKWAAELIRQKQFAYSGEQSHQGFGMLQKIWLTQIKNALSSGYYDSALKNGILDKFYVKDILKWFNILKNGVIDYNSYKSIVNSNR